MLLVVFPINSKTNYSKVALNAYKIKLKQNMTSLN